MRKVDPLLKIPREPLARFRLLALWFVLFTVLANTADIGLAAGMPADRRILALVAGLGLAGWYSAGYRRGGFPAAGWVVDGALLAIMGSASTIPLRAMGVFFAACQLRALYVPRRQLPLLVVTFAVARVLSIVFAGVPSPYAPFSLTVIVQVVGLGIIATTFHLLCSAIASQAAAELALKRSEERLKQAQKLEAIGQLAGGVAHDFNNLLTIIGGHVFLLEQTLPPGARVERHLTGITRATERAANLTKKLLAFSRKQLLHPTVLNLNAVVSEVAETLRPVLGEGVHIEIVLDPLLSPALADAGQLEQVLVNLAVNARDAMGSTGTLTITTTNATIDATDPATDSPSGGAPLPAGDYVQLTIRDTGAGMDATTLARAFEPFFTTKAPGKGTGLGLATVYGIVKQSYGDVWVQSAPGAGATFTVLLPVAKHVEDDPSTRPRVAATSVGASPAAPTRVLLVDDDDEVREFAREVLSRHGFRVLTARDGLDGLRVALSNNYAFDVVVTDVVMPEMGGLQMVKQLRGLRPNLDVLYISGYADRVRTRSELDVDGRYLEKPYTAAALERAVLAGSRQ